MLKRTLWILLCCLPFGIFAQEDEPKDEKETRTFIASVWVGLNASQIDGDDLAGYDKLGLTGGVKAFIVLHPRWQPSVEIAYSQKGSSSELSLSGNSTETRITLDYAHVPIMMNYVDRRIQFSAGFAYGQLVRAKVQFDPPNPDAADFYKKSDFSFLGSATFFFTKNMGVNLRWERSLINIIKDPDQQSQVNKLITFRLGYKF
ncbi:MAG: outer membrane beta-barrel protein [Bacteroidota bacterium]